MVGTEIKGCLQTDHRITGKHAFQHTFAKALFNGGEVLLGNGTANDFIEELKFIGISGLKANINITELAMTAGLLFMPAVGFIHFSNSLSVSNLRNRKVNLNTEFCPELGNDNIQVLFAEAGKHLLMCFTIGFKFNCLVLFHKPSKAGSNLIFFALFADLNSH